ncbi:hypothetical protein [Pseudomonas sp. Teo4]|uniref:hypothetical protein n=1 Tax=Pseudomonas sp. Teo4 TaxID=3064528 RepID=UPI002AB9EE9B|nr:hypothetical protein [Pseudomonas sp. Teo4]MDZ3991864.1 hypothetical protein [Pseudomonas sp. Teo4]
MNVYVEKKDGENRWWVHMDAWYVSFNTCSEAEHFVDRLNARLNAPHSLEMLAAIPAKPHWPSASTRPGDEQA